MCQDTVLNAGAIATSKKVMIFAHSLKAQNGETEADINQIIV